MGPRVRHQLSIGRVVHRLDADHSFLELAVVPVQVPLKLQLGGAGAHDQELFGLLQRDQQNLSMRAVADRGYRTKVLGTAPRATRYLTTGPRYWSSHLSVSATIIVRGRKCPPSNRICFLCAAGVPSSRKNGRCDVSNGNTLS